MYIIFLFNYVSVEHGCYIGFKPNFTVWVPISSQKLQEIELAAEDETDLARKLFIIIFKEDLERRPNEICCTEAEGKELLNQQYLQGIRCKFIVYNRTCIHCMV